MRRVVVALTAALCSFAAATQAATIIITCDNDYDLYVNGTYIGYEGGWQIPETWEIDLRAGRNVVAVIGRDGSPSHYCGNGQGLIVEIHSDDGEILTSDSTWVVSVDSAAGWYEIDHDDTAWQSAGVCGATWDAEPWSFVDLIGIMIFADNGAQWIWHGPFTSPPECESMHSVYDRVFFRKSFNYSPPVPVELSTWGAIKALYEMEDQ